MGLRRRSREIALQVLFQSEFGSMNAEQAMALYLDNFEADADIKEYAVQIVRGVWEITFSNSSSALSISGESVAPVESSAMSIV